MNAQALLTDLSRRGIRLTAEHGYLCVEAPRGAIDDDLKRLLAANKAQLLVALARPLKPASEAVEAPHSLISPLERVNLDADPFDDRIRCRDCRYLSCQGRCTGEPGGRPHRDIVRRCGEFQPGGQRDGHM